MSKNSNDILRYFRKRIEQVNLMLKESSDKTDDLFMLGKRAAYQEVIITIEGMGDNDG